MYKTRSALYRSDDRLSSDPTVTSPATKHILTDEETKTLGHQGDGGGVGEADKEAAMRGDKGDGRQNIFNAEYI